MHDALALLVEFFFGDPDGLELRHLREDSAAQPARVLAVCGRLNVGLHGRGSERTDLLVHALLNALKHRAPARKHDVPEQVLLDVRVALHDRVVRELVDPVFTLHVALQRRCKEKFRAFKSFFLDFNCSTSW